MSTRRILPVYIAVETSKMAFRWLDTAQTGISRLRGELLASPIMGEFVRTSLISFADRAELLIPLSDITESSHIPRLHSRGGTQWGPLFDLLSKTIERDLSILRHQDLHTYRPQITMLMGNPPSDKWQSSYSHFQRSTSSSLTCIILHDNPQADKAIASLDPENTVKIVASAHTSSDLSEAILGSARLYFSSFLTSIDPDSGDLRPSTMYNIDNDDLDWEIQ